MSHDERVISFGQPIPSPNEFCAMKTCPVCNTDFPDQLTYCSNAGAVPSQIPFPPRKSNKRLIILIVVIVAFVLFVPVILIVAAIAIPALLSSRAAANETSALITIRSINTAEFQYESTYGRGFACSLATLAGDP